MDEVKEKQTQDVGFELAEKIAHCKYEDLPNEAVEATKKTILDTFGTIIGGSGAGAGVKEIVAMVKDGGGTQESSVIGYGFKTNAWMAAFANGAMAHTLDYDNVHDDAFTHPSTSTVPSGFAMAEKVGNISGKDFITAVALGDDLHCRLAYSVSQQDDFVQQNQWMMPVLMGGFAAATVAGKIIGLDKMGFVNALGIAFNRAGGSEEIIHDPGLLRGLYAAFPAITGVLSAIMAHYGIPGIKTCFEGEAGLFNAYFKGRYDRNALTRDLGKVFKGSGVSYKPWPSCRFTHPYVDAALQLAKEHDLHAEDVAEIRAAYEAKNVKMCFEPLNARRNPGSPTEAKISLPFTIAMAIALRKIEIGDFCAENLKSRQILDLAQKVTYRYDPSLKGEYKTMLPAEIELKTRDGSLYTKRVDSVYGHPNNPMTWKDLTLKFKDCVSYAAKPISRENIKMVVDKIKMLEDAADVSELVRLIN